MDVRFYGHFAKRDVEARTVEGCPGESMVLVARASLEADTLSHSSPQREARNVMQPHAANSLHSSKNEDFAMIEAGVV
jgi:hypothetical protein